MKIKKLLFYAGATIAILLAAVVSDLVSLEAISRTLAVAKLPPELRMAYDLGIIDPGDIRWRTLDVPIQKREFALLLRNACQLLGFPAGSSLKNLAASGIFDNPNSEKVISRKRALETLCRAVLAFADFGMVSLGKTDSEGFSDYRPPEKYQSALAYLMEKGVARGYGDGYFGVGRALSKREAAYLVFRLYEQVSAGLMKKKEGEITFVDLPSDHVAMNTIRFLAKCGAFDKIRFRPSFDGNRALSLGDCLGIVSGIIEKNKLSEGLSKLPAVWRGMDPRTPTTRGLFAMILEILVSSSEPSEGVHPVEYIYHDVVIGSAEEKALSALARFGIVIGYPNGILRGNEYLSWFEAIGVIEAVVKSIKIPHEASLDESSQGDQLLKKSEFEDFVKVVKEKKERIRSILKQKPLKNPRS